MMNINHAKFQKKIVSRTISSELPYINLEMSSNFPLINALWFPLQDVVRQAQTPLRTLRSRMAQLFLSEKELTQVL